MGIARGPSLLFLSLSPPRRGGEKKIGTSLGWDGGEGGGGNHHHVKSEKKGGEGGRKAQRQQHSLQQLSFPFLGRSEEAKEEEVSIDGGEEGKGGIPPSFTRLAAGCARAPPPSAQLRGETVLGRKWGERGRGWRRGTNPPLFKVSLGWWRREEERGLLYAPVGLAGYIG